MKSALLSISLGLTLSLVATADDPPAAETPSFTLPSIEEKYASEASKADATVAKAEAEAARTKKIAAEARLKAYKDKLVEITKTGDFDKAQQVKARITQLEAATESDPPKKDDKHPKRPRPKDAVKFGGHTYALIKEPATWHVAKQRCEEMGGHLACIDNPKELALVVELCRTQKTGAWVGATDEEVEGAWRWLDGSPSELSSPHVSKVANEQENFLMFDLNLNDWNDAGAGRAAYVCEWDR